MTVLPLPRLAWRVALLFACATVPASLAHADQYDAPSSYYNAATGTGSTLRTQLRTIISTGFIGRSYGDARYAFALLDRDPNNASNVLLVYNRASISSAWNGNTFNREHLWPQSLLNVDASNDYVGPGSDLFELRPCNVAINNNRGNLPYGVITNPTSTFGQVNGSGGTYYFPGNPDRGDVARSMFYMATRYSNLNLKNGQATTYNMGDLASLLAYHYQDEVDTFERRRNHYIHSQSLNPTYYQNNRNPFIDHPEYVWTIFGTGANTSTLAVSTPAADGSSSRTLNFGKVIVGSSFSSQTLTLNKTGTTPTTFDVTTSGSIASTLDGPRHSFDFGAGSRAMTVSITGGTSTVGSRSGTLTFDNTDITPGAAAGQGASDGNDVVNVSASVVAHSDPSFSASASVKTLAIDFGIVAQGSAMPDVAYAIGNYSTINNDAFTAGLDVDSSSATGNTARFINAVGTATNLAAGSTLTRNASLRTDQLGTFAANYSIMTSDENIPGAVSFAPLSLALSGTVALGGDATLDSLVDFDDLLILAQNYESSAPSAWASGDFTRDGATNFDDLLVLAQNYTGSAFFEALNGFGASFAADWTLARSLVPEPATLALLTISTLTLRRRR